MVSFYERSANTMQVLYTSADVTHDLFYSCAFSKLIRLHERKLKQNDIVMYIKLSRFRAMFT